MAQWWDAITVKGCGVMPPRAQQTSRDAVQPEASESIFCLDVLCKLLLCPWPGHPWVASPAASGTTTSMHLAAALCTLPRC
eukprot:917962-Rhodomonas_salina.1